MIGVSWEIRLAVCLPISWGEASGEIGTEPVPHRASGAEFEALVFALFVPVAMCLLDGQQEVDVADGLVQVIRELPAPGELPADQHGGG